MFVGPRHSVVRMCCGIHMCCSVLQCVAVCCSVWLCVAVCCRVGDPEVHHVCGSNDPRSHCNTLQHTATHCNTL